MEKKREHYLEIWLEPAKKQERKKGYTVYTVRQTIHDTNVKL